MRNLGRAVHVHDHQDAASDAAVGEVDNLGLDRAERRPLARVTAEEGAAGEGFGADVDDADGTTRGRGRDRVAFGAAFFGCGRDRVRLGAARDLKYPL